MSDIVNEVLAARYFREGESSWGDVCRRVADYVGNTDDEREIYYDMMVNKDFVPNSPTLMNAGTEIGQLSACFVIPVNDSMESIFDAIKNAALIHKAAGGTGFSFGNLRPEGDIVNGTDGVASGPISFMKVFNAATDAVKQGSKRRGANMGVLPVWHPDIEKFITCKNTEGDLSNFNISVMIDDVFIKAVKYDADYDLIFNNKVYKTIRAKELFNKIVDGISKTGEPGVLFYKTINDDNTCKHLGNIEATNPCGEEPLLPYESCLTSDTIIRTEDKIYTIGELFEIDTQKKIVSFNNMELMSKFAKVKENGIKDVYKIMLEGGISLKATLDHKIMTINGWKTVEELDINDEVITQKTIPLQIEEIGDNYINEEMLGWMHGDGWYNGTVGISFNMKDGDFEAKERYLQAFKDIFNCNNTKSMYDNDSHYQIQTENKKALKKAEYYGMYRGLAKTKRIPSKFYKWNLTAQRAFLRGLFSADGGVSGKSKSQINYASTSETLIDELQIVLITMGIQSRKYETTFKNSNRNNQYKLTITKESAKRFMELIGFSLKHKNEKFNYESKNYIDKNLKVIKKEYYSKEMVYDIWMPETGCFFANGILVHNCNLGSINLSNFVNNNRLMPKDLINTIELSTEFLDKIIDLNKYPIEEIAEASRKTRKIGLGYMGFHHMLMKMGIPYDSSDALYQAKKVMGILNDMSVLTSRELAKELGVFPAYEGSNWFLHDIPVRNATTTCIAPTGSIATLCETSYGIEPVFSLVHKRYTWVDGEKKGYLMVDPVFEEKLNNYIESHVEVTQWDKKKQEVINHAYETGTIQDITWLPIEFKSVFKTALDIDWKAHIDMQAAFQQYCHAAISKTINMPSSATKEDIRSAILYAYEKKCKGVTIYVTGSRNDIVMELKKDSTPAPITILPDGRILPKRPSDLPATNSKRRSGCGKLIISVAEKDGKPYECIINNKGGCTAMNDALGQMISLSMRWNVPTWDIIKTLRNVTCPVAYKKFSEGNCDGKSCSDVIGRVIESLIPDKESEPISIPCKEEIKTEDNICPECGEHLSMVEGCKTCACGYSRCG